MGTIQREKNIGYIQVNDTYTIDIDIVTNQNQNLVGDVKVALTIPAGVAYQSSTLDQGVYVAGPNEWQIGTVLPNTTIEGSITFIVTDDSLNPYEHVFVLTAGSGCVACFQDDRLEVTVDGVSCSNVKDCIGSLPAYDDDTDAGNNGLIAGDVYQTTGSGAAPLNTAGIVKIVQ